MKRFIIALAFLAFSSTCYAKEPTVENKLDILIMNNEIIISTIDRVINTPKLQDRENLIDFLKSIKGLTESNITFLKDVLEDVKKK